jgi:phenylacetate-coenzyme A ligase PaaK-like adenylate-forming protein
MKPYNSILENIVLPLGDAILGTGYMSTLRKWRGIQQFSSSGLQQLQDHNLSRVLKHAASNIPFYKKYSPGSGTQSIGHFPILTKSLIRENIDDLLWHPEIKTKLICERSSGSSGIQGEVYMSRKEQSVFQAIQTLTWEWAGFRLGNSLLQTGMTLDRGLVKSLKDVLFKTKYVSAFDLDDAGVAEILSGLHNKKMFLGGYASSLWVYAKVAKEKNLDEVEFENVISWGDKMFQHYREIIEQQFRTRVFDTYGTTEGFMIAGQKDLPYYYILTPHVYLELLDEVGREVPDGEMGQVVVTRLDAFEMPLIRYYLGDLAVKLPKERYPDKRELQFPLLEKIIGRDTDIVRTNSGKRMIVHFFTGIFEHFPEVSQFRVVQNSLNEITIEYIPSETFREEVLDILQERIHSYLNEPFPIRFLKVNSIPPSPSGKPQIIVSKIN